jgi:TonB family protein
MAQENNSKVLRVGVIYNGKILDEQIFRKPETVFVGDSEKSHFVVPSSSLPSKFPIVYFKSGRYELVIMENMTGKVFLKGKVIVIEEVIKKGMLKKRGGAYILPLSQDSRGKVMVGSAIVLFQFITPPPRPPKLKLPKSIRGSWTQRLDWPFLSILSVSLISGYLFFGVYVPGVPIPEFNMAKIPNRFAELIVPNADDLKMLEEEEKEVATEDSGNQVATAKEEKKEVAKEETKKPDQPRDKATIQKEESIRKAEMQKKVAGKGLLRLIGSVGGEGGSGDAVSDVLGDGGKDRDIDTALAGIKQIGVASSSTQRSRKGDADATETVKMEGLDVKKSDGKVGVAAKKERAVVAKTTIETPQVDGAVDSNSISQVVRRNQAAVRRCYERELNANPNLRGKVSVTIIINERGRIQMADVSEDTVGSPAVKKCILGVVNRWRFPRPEGGPASVTIPFVFSSSN